MTGDRKLLVQADKGWLALYDFDQIDKKWQPLSAEHKPLFRTDVWPHLVLADRHLLCKDRNGNLLAFRWK